MYHLQIQSSFTATHAIMMQGVLETPHEHDWRLRLRVLGKELDEDGSLEHEFQREVLQELQLGLGRFDSSWESDKVDQLLHRRCLFASDAVGHGRQHAAALVVGWRDVLA